MKLEVEKAVAAIRAHYTALRIEVFRALAGGAYALIHEVPLGPPYAHATTWGRVLHNQRLPIRRHLSVDVRPDLSRQDGAALKAPLHVNNKWAPQLPDLEARPAVTGVAAPESHQLFGSRDPTHQAADGDRMDTQAIGCGWSLRMSQALYEHLHARLFPGDGDQHGAVMEAGLATLGGRQAPSARRAVEGRGPGGLAPRCPGLSDVAGGRCNQGIRDCCADGLVYLAIHNHGGRDRWDSPAWILQPTNGGFPPYWM